MPSDNQDRLVDVCEELVKVTSILRPQFDLLGDRFSERKERSAFGKLRTQAEKEAVEKILDNEDSE
jgi:arsenic resistance protein ArsH